MGFSVDDVMEIIQIVKECKDSELHIDTGDIKLSLFKGDVGGSARSPMPFSGPVCMANQTEQPGGACPASLEPATIAQEASAGEPAASEALKASDIDIDEEGLHKVKASVPSVFYRKPSPEEPPFVEEGDAVEADTVLCLLEVMKCYRQVMAEVKGKIMKICVDSNTLVEEGTTLFLIKPE